MPKCTRLKDLNGVLKEKKSLHKLSSKSKLFAVHKNKKKIATIVGKIIVHSSFVLKQITQQLYPSECRK